MGCVKRQRVKVYKGILAYIQILKSITIADTATAFQLWLRLHYKPAHAASLMRHSGQGLRPYFYEELLLSEFLDYLSACKR